MILDVTTAKDGVETVDAVIEAMEDADMLVGALTGPIEVHVHVCRPRLKASYGTGGLEGILKDTADAYPVDRGAITQAVAVLDACDGLVWAEGAVTAAILTCGWGERSTRIRIREAPARSVRDLIRLELAEAPIIEWADP